MQMLRFSATAADCFNANIMIAYRTAPMIVECITMTNPRSAMIGLDWIGLDWIGLDWIGLDWIGLDWIGLDWIGLDWI